MDARITGEYIRGKRLLLNLSQEQLAEKAGTSTRTISMWETGSITQMRFDKLTGLANALGVSESEIIMGKDFTNLDEETKAAISAEMKELMERVGDIQSITINVEDRGVLALDVAVFALAVAYFSLAVAFGTMIPRNPYAVIGSLAFSILGILFITVGRSFIKRIAKRIKSRRKEVDGNRQ